VTAWVPQQEKQTVERLTEESLKEERLLLLLEAGVGDAGPQSPTPSAVLS
jgi:hypothetical protein